ncbi:MAG: hypothetical protein WC342_05335 [Methanoregula sp.]|jgi:hypothetical protein
MATGKIIFTALVGAIYAVFGIVQILAGILPDLATALEPYSISGDIVQGFVLCVIGSVFLYGTAEMHARRAGAEAFLYVGLLLSLAFGIIMLLDVCAIGIDTVVFGEEGENTWELVSFAVPMLYLAIFSVIGFAAWGRKFVKEIATA